MKPPILVVHWLASALVFALAACVAQMESLGQTGSGELQVLSTLQPGETQIPEETPWLTPQLVNPAGTPYTPTPELYPADPSLVTPEIYPTPTPWPVRTMINRAEGLPEDQTWIIMVQRAEGVLERYVLPLAEVPKTNEEYLAFRDNLVKFAPGDMLAFEGLANRIERPVPYNPFLEAGELGTPTPSTLPSTP